ncbi:hypothetical protein [uncultured Polaribacter sp.]|uniref:hypothetical protein n=1 Tax=uncultured Polaribacter sp. TaxID=174711 RepID=UPI002614B32F|nr:hypothetical protein [uncultured Polaribacter sp.]
MKKIIILICCISLSSCFFNWQERGDEPLYSRFEPVTLTVAELENSIEILDKKEITEASKIYIINDYIFINDKRTGFHIFDNTDTSNPIKKKFLKAPGATDIAIRNNVLYINQATDLVALTFNFNTLKVAVNKRVKNVFPELISPDGEYYVEDGKVVVNWIQN